MTLAIFCSLCCSHFCWTQYLIIIKVLLDMCRKCTGRLQCGPAIVHFMSVFPINNICTLWPKVSKECDTQLYAKGDSVREWGKWNRQKACHALRKCNYATLCKSIWMFNMSFTYERFNGIRIELKLHCRRRMPNWCGGRGWCWDWGFESGTTSVTKSQLKG